MRHVYDMLGMFFVARGVFIAVNRTTYIWPYTLKYAKHFADYNWMPFPTFSCCPSGIIGVFRCSDQGSVGGWTGENRAWLRKRGTTPSGKGGRPCQRTTVVVGVRVALWRNHIDDDRIKEKI